jgi:hypothetical protein
VRGKGDTTAIEIFGTTGPSLGFLGTIGLFALGGSCARLFWDAATDAYTARRQVGFVGVSIVLAYAIAFLLWDRSREYPAFILGLTTLVAMVGPVDALQMVRDFVLRLVRDAGAP